MRKTEMASLGILALIFLAAAYIYPQLPERIATHWNERGEVNGYMTRFWGLFIIPLITLFITLLFLAAPRIDPLKANIEQFRKEYDGFVIVFLLFMAAVFAHVALWNKGVRMNPLGLVSVGLGAMFIYLGAIMGRIKPNWFIGIRTPWTMSDPKVWEETHRVGGYLFIAAGVSALFGALLPEYAVYFILAPALLVSLATIVYSYVVYRRETKQ